VETLFDLTDEEAEAIMRASRRVGRAIVKAFSADGMLIYQNNGRVSGQTVPHYHLHVVPQHDETSRWGAGPQHIARVEGKEFVRGRPTMLTDQESGEVAARIRACL
jgi:diadenosine tetraphosphate (Ap4A) HIT family hydrolase